MILHASQVTLWPACCAIVGTVSSQINTKWRECSPRLGVHVRKAITAEIAERKSGEMHEQVCDQDLDAGNVLDGGDRRSAVHQGLCSRWGHSLSAADEHEGQEEGQQELQHRRSEIPRGLSHCLYDDL